MSTGQHPAIMFDLATSIMADRRRGDRARDQRAAGRRTRGRRVR